MKDEVQFTMRMEKKTYDALKKSAANNKRSIAKELEYITEHYLLYGSSEAKEFTNLLKMAINTEGFKDYIRTVKNDRLDNI